MIINRRKLIMTTAATAVGVAGLCAPSIATASPIIAPDRLWIRREDTGETMNDVFIYQSQIAARAAHALYSHFWRDVKDGGQMVWMDRALLVILSDLQAEVKRIYGVTSPIDLFSGYRTPRRNATIEGAATNSLHMRAKAGDLRIRGLSPRQVADIAVGIRGVGGVGRYPTFTHIDSGPAGRRWGRN